MQTLLTNKTTITGVNSLEHLSEQCRSYGKKAMLVTGTHTSNDGTTEKILNNLKSVGIEAIVFDQIISEPTNKMIEEGLRLYKENHCDFFIGLGGGSPLDAMKAIAAMTVNDGQLSDYVGVEITGELPPMIAIPTTAGTGSETTQFTIITDTDTQVKMLLKGRALMPTLTIIDSSLTITSPKGITASSGIDALTHAIEAYTSKKATEASDEYAIRAIKRIFQSLPAAYHNDQDEETREQMAMAAFEAGISFNNSSLTLVHGMSRPIGALFHVPHGISNAMLLTFCLRYALDGALERFATLGKSIGVADDTMNDEDSAKAFLKGVERLCRTCEIPTLEQYGIKRDLFFDKIDKMATDAMASGSPSNTRKNIDVDTIKKLYYRLWT